MYDLVHIRASKFRLYDDVKMSVNGGVFFVAGSNEDVPVANSNMSGKTTLTTAVLWCLYGCDITGKMLAGDVVSQGASSASVTLKFHDKVAGDQVFITRYRHNAKIATGQSRNYLELVPTHKGATLGITTKGTPEQVQQHVDKIFGPAALFIASHTFTLTEGSTPFALAGDTQQKNFFDLLIGVEDLDAALVNATGALHGVDKRISEVTAAQDAILSKIEVLENSITATPHTTGLMKLKKDLVDQQAEEKKDIASARTLRATRDALVMQHSSMVEGKSDHIKQMDASKEQLAVHTEDQARTLALDIVGMVEEAMRTSGGAATCVVCGSNKGAKSLKTRLTFVKTVAFDLETAYETVLAIYEKKWVDPLNARNVALAHKDTQISVAKKHEALAIQKASRASATVDATAQLIKDQETATGDRIDFLNKCKDAEILKKDNQKVALEGLETERTVAQFWKTAFGPKGIRAHRLDRVTPILNQAARALSKEVFGDATCLRYSTQSRTKAGELREKFEVALYEEKQTNAKEGISQYVKVETALSAGQAMRRDIINTLSIAALVSKVGKRTVSWLSLDEIFRTLDAAGVEAVAKLITSLGTEIRTVWVAEHNDDLQAHFAKCLLVSRKGGKSTIEEVAA